MLYQCIRVKYFERNDTHVDDKLSKVFCALLNVRCKGVLYYCCERSDYDEKNQKHPF